jgi:hypothetical protein
MDCDDKSHKTGDTSNTIEGSKTENPKSVSHLKVDLIDVKKRNPLYRALWTVRGLARAYGRMPSIAEALAVYEEFGIGTGPCTPRRIRHFDEAIAFTARTFDPKKVKKTGFLRQYPFLKQRIE